MIRRGLKTLLLGPLATFGLMLGSDIGCASPPGYPEAPLVGGSQLWGSPSADQKPSEMHAETPPVPTPLTMRAAIEYARRWHPRLQSAREQVRMAEGERMTASSRPNPTFTLSGENFPLGGTSHGFRAGRDLDWFAFLSYTLETGHKRQRRTEAADWAIRSAHASLDETDAEIVAEVKRAYARAQLERARLELARENLETFRQIVQYNQVRVAEGYTAEGDLIKVQLEAQRAELHLQSARLHYERAKIELLRAIGASRFDQDVELKDELTFDPVSLDWNALEQMTLRRPELRRAEAEMERARALWELERARAWPDVTASFGYKRNGPDNALYVAVSLPLPLFSRNQGQIERADAEWRRAEAHWRWVRATLLAEFQAARRAVEIAAEQVEGVRRQFLQRAEASRAVALAAYREGAADLLLVLEAQRAHAAARELYVEALFAYARALHEVERVTGVDHLPRTVSSRLRRMESSTRTTTPRADERQHRDTRTESDARTKDEKICRGDHPRGSELCRRIHALARSSEPRAGFSAVIP